LPTSFVEENHDTTEKIRTCLWFGGNAEGAAEFYFSVFKESRASPSA
jgi:predicted 3-demethylubiquinone-9 3-methyltransferase (glyoxalase superfamily)